MSQRDQVTMKGNPITLLGTAAIVGKPGENFRVVDMGLQPVTLDNFAGKIKIISVVPSIDTGVCSIQTKRFEEEAKTLDNVAVLTISVDLPFAQKRFADENCITHQNLLSDYQTHDFGIEYGFEIEGLALLSRGIVVLDQNNIIRHVEYVQEVTNEPDYDKALEVAKSL
ncbi:thiol peroxidase [Wohlfahrtiimonas chitiniclastica]|uniref:Thiol peroxidase n=1 Tax=Wohlfahrtiimonas chitiniclastica TaxID=400946 RepID=A0AB35BYC7_9GAMM|nr:thiol peroxidase [Wohlfahrtiimonas chitiniclastica]MBS7824078.1 thiol peroxidase [Wohlfahrtiimonas chitiniclastica]MBS7840186.1 thiol peroxidase [Wohlfahrtiimonas chitiniclastica]